MGIYTEYTPLSSLQSILDCYWSYAADPESNLSNQKLIIPDGCIDIIFDLGNQANLNSFVIGAMTKPIESRRTNLIGVRFKPGMAYPFLNTPLHKLTDTIVDFVEFEGHKANDFLNQLADINSIKKRINLLNRFFLKRLSNLNTIQPQLSQALSLIQITRGRCSVKQISKLIGWSRQHLARNCLRCTGLTPRFLIRVVRIKNVIDQCKTGEFYGWSQLSHDAGYFDQSHMINEFKKISGLTPIEYLSIK
jgi:AraC-like DNA-binding protein